MLSMLNMSSFNRLWSQTTMVHSTGIPSTFQAVENLCGPVYQSWVEVYHMCILELEARLLLLNHSYVSLRYYKMGFLPMLKEMADVSVPLWYEKFNLKGWEKEWCTAYFHSPTLRDMRMMFRCVEEMMPIVLQRNSFIIQFNFIWIPMASSSAREPERQRQKGRARD